MADSRLDLAKAFVNATIASRKETSRIEDLTSSILARYKELPGVLGSIGTLFKAKVGYSQLDNKATKDSMDALRAVKAEHIQILRLREAELDRISEMQDKLTKGDLSAKQRNTLTLQMEKAKISARNYEIQLGRIDKELTFMQKVAVPAAKSLDGIAQAQNRLSDAVRMTGLGKMLSISAEINKALINANASLATRNQLLQVGLKVAAQTGVSMKTLNEAQSSLVDLGFDLKNTYEETLRITTQLIDGLGMSAQEAASLAVTARTTNSQFKDLSNVISSIVDTTALAADEAARYAKELANASRVAAGGGGRFDAGSFSQNLKVVSQLEGAMKGTMAVQGDLAGMLVKFTSFQKQGGMGLAFGTGGLDFLSQDQGAAKRVMMNIARTVKDANGIMLEAYAGMLDTNKETLAALGQLYREKGEEMFTLPPEMQERADLERRYREQISQQGEAFRLLGDKLIFLGAKAIGPLLTVVNFLADRVVWLAQRFEDTKVVAIPAMVAVSTVVVSSTFKMVKALWQFATTAVAVSTALNARYGGGGKGAIAGSAAGGAVEALGGVLAGRLKKGAVAAGAEAVGGSVVKGFLGRIFGGLAGAFSGTMMRGLLGRGIALVGSAFLTGGWSLIIGLVVTLVAQFWPNLVSLFKGKGWSGDAGAKRAQGEDKTLFSKTVYARAEGLAMEVATQDRAMLMRKLKMLEHDAYESGDGANAADLLNLRKMVAEAAGREIVSFAGKAQRSQGLDLAKDNENAEILKAMHRTTEELNGILRTFSDTFAKNEQDKARREQIAKEEKTRAEAARIRQLEEWSGNSLSVPRY